MEAHQQQRYRVLERLAAGGMAEVFLAESAGIEGFKKLVAIKRVLPSLVEKKAFIRMFLDEARVCANLTHSNVVQVFDIGVGENAYFIVMEYVDGADLKALLEYNKRAGKTFSVEQACYVAARICEGLTYAHEVAGPDGQPLSIVHRDMSPPNVLITKHGEVKIVDFGLAKATSQLEKSEAGIIKGKFGYLSPEAAQAKEVDLRTDIFAVGIILWEMLAGRRLFYGETDFETVKQVQEAKIPSLRALNPAVPVELEQILARALAKDPASRYASARDLGRDLTTFLYKLGKPVTAYDIAEVVKSAVALRKRSQPDKASIIDKLIEEALLEFTSLQEQQDAPAGAPKKADQPAKLGFEDIGNWADELGTGASKAEPPPSIEPGDLASLEDTSQTKLPDAVRELAKAEKAKAAATKAEAEASRAESANAEAPTSKALASKEATALAESPKKAPPVAAIAAAVALVLAVVGYLAFGR
jgi:serine/threonine-protein kinase